MGGLKFNTEAYQDGADAARRVGIYKVFKGEGVPVCPYSDDSDENGDWWNGFEDATEDMVDMVYGE